MLSDPQKDEAVRLAQEIAKYAFMTAFALSFPRDRTLIDHNRENLKRFTDELLELGSQT